MDDIIEISSLDDLGGSSTSNVAGGKFGEGIELLMNEKKDNPKSSDGIDIGDLEQLEADLNEVSDNIGVSKSSIFTEPIPDLGASDAGLDEKQNVTFEEPSLGEKTGGNPTTSTWDGFNKFNEIPVTPDKPMSSKPTQSKEDALREKFQLLRKLESLEQKGAQLSKKYTMESSILEMKGEYETIMDEKARQNSIKFQGNMLMTCINGLEFLNNRFDPFDLKLDGWSEQVGENIDDYDEVFSELYDKYKSKATMAPELRLLFQLGGSAAMLHMTNSMFKSAMPGMDDVLRQNPELAKQFQKAAVDSMSNSSPGFSGFMNNMTNPEPSPMRGTGPPPAMATQGPNAMPPPSSRPGNTNSYASRPDLSRSTMSSNDGINITESFASASAPERSARTQVPQPPPVQPIPEKTPTSRAEMKGPSDIDNILSNLKTKKVSMGNSPSIPETSSQNINDIDIDNLVNESSTISISDLKEMQSVSASAPKKSRRRRNSDKNTISLDI